MEINFLKVLGFSKKIFKYLMLIGKPEGKLLASLFWKFKSGHFVKKP